MVLTVAVFINVFEGPDMMLEEKRWSFPPIRYDSFTFLYIPIPISHL
jgi:hypothetical protein